MTARAVALDGYPRDTPYSHLLPVLEAELEWGNDAMGGFCPLPDGWWAATFMRPLHIDRLQAAFDFPDHIKVGRDDDGRTFVVDGHNLVSLGAAAPRRSRGGPSLLSRMLKR